MVQQVTGVDTATFTVQVLRAAGEASATTRPVDIAAAFVILGVLLIPGGAAGCWAAALSRQARGGEASEGYEMKGLIGAFVWRAGIVLAVLGLIGVGVIELFNL